MREEGIITYREICVPVKNFRRLRLSRIKDIPVVYGSICNEPQACFAEPLPKYNILIHCGRLELLFLYEVEDLKGSLLGFEGDDLLVPMHDGTISFDRLPNDVVVILHVDDDDFGGIGRLLRLANAYEGV